MNTSLPLKVFEANERELWSEYSKLLKKSSKDISSIKKLRDIYSNIATHYAFLVNYYPESQQRKELAGYLHSARRLLNIPVKDSTRSFVYSFFSLYLQKIPHQIYQHRRLFFLSFLIFCSSVVASYTLTVYSPEFGSSFLGSSQYHHYKSKIESGFKFQNFFLPNTSGPVVFIEVFINNFKVSIYALLGGMLFGLGTLYVLIKNAFLVGGLLGIYYQSEYFIDFVSTIFQHGFLELMAIILSGASGFLLASPYFFSGYIKKKDLFVKKAKQAMILYSGAVSLLLIAALIEGFITILNLPVSNRFTVIAFTMLCFILYFIYSLRRLFIFPKSY